MKMENKHIGREWEGEEAENAPNTLAIEDGSREEKTTTPALLMAFLCWFVFFSFFFKLAKYI